jgi:hypothetical protein
MNKKLNCWDVKKCCSETGNKNICPVKKEFSAHGLNGGINGGRICWVIMDTHRKRKAQTACFQCEFHYKVMEEEGLLNNCNATGTYLGNLETNNS